MDPKKLETSKKEPHKLETSKKESEKIETSKTDKQAAGKKTEKETKKSSKK